MLKKILVFTLIATMISLYYGTNTITSTYDHVIDDKGMDNVSHSVETDVKDNANIPQDNDDTLKPQNEQTLESFNTNNFSHEEQDVEEIIVTEKQEAPITTPQKPVVRYINPDDYSEKISYTGFSQYEIDIINMILKEYQRCDKDNVETQPIRLDTIPSYENYSNVCSFFYLYYGNINTDIRDLCFDFHIMGNEYAEIILHIDKMQEYDTIRQKNLALIKENLRTVQDGSEAEKVTHIAEHIANTISYTKGYHDVENALQGRGVCNSYAVLFMQYCQVIGVKNDVCIGNALGEKHAWNKVTYSDGTVEYYDITFFDINNKKDYSYFKMKQSPHELKSINIYY